MTSTIDWTGQLEAYHEDGRVVPVTLEYIGDDDCRCTVEDLPDMPQVWFANGVPWVVKCGGVLAGWRIRNAKQASTEAPQATPPILPSTEQLDRFEAPLGRLEGILGAINKGEAA